MKPLYKGLLLMALQLAIVLSLGAKLLSDRATRPRVWARALPYDPELPIRGRYVSLQLEVSARNVYATPLPPAQTRNRWQESQWVRLGAENGQLIVTPSEPMSGIMVTRRLLRNEEVAFLSEPVLYFIPEHADDPSRRPMGEELWVEVTVPKKGLPRPIRLGVKKNGVLTPLDLR